MFKTIVTQGHCCQVSPFCPSARTDHDAQSAIENLKCMGITATYNRLHAPLQGPRRPDDILNAMGIAVTVNRLRAPLGEETNMLKHMGVAPTLELLAPLWENGKT